MFHRIFLLSVFIISLSACATNQVASKYVIDGSSVESFEKSYKRMITRLSQQKQIELAVAMLQLKLQGTQSAIESMAIDVNGPPSEKLLSQLDGKSFQEIIEFVKTLDTPQVMIGDGPGLSSEFASPLTKTNVTSFVELTETSWVMTQNKRSGKETQLYTFLSDGTVKTTVKDSKGIEREISKKDRKNDLWFQEGNKFRMTMNDDYAVYIGDIVDPNTMKGKFQNVSGYEFQWTARIIVAEGDTQPEK